MQQLRGMSTKKAPFPGPDQCVAKNKGRISATFKAWCGADRTTANSIFFLYFVFVNGCLSGDF